MFDPPPPGVIVVWSDIGCPWAHVCVARLHRFRERLGLAGSVSFDHRAFGLEIVNERPTPKLTLDAEVPVAGALEPDAGWQMWQRPEWTYPVTTLPALEAVQAAKLQSPEAAEELDRALRTAMFGESRCISLRPVILEVAGRCPAVDAGALAKALDVGTARATLMAQVSASLPPGPVQGSPHLFLPDGTGAHNPGVEVRWVREKGRGFPVVDRDDPSVYEDLLRRAAADAAS